jgi:hypothetical protein
MRRALLVFAWAAGAAAAAGGAARAASPPLAPPDLVVVDPVTPPPSPMPGPVASLQLDPGRFELFKLPAAAGKVTWRVVGPAGVLAVERLTPNSRLVAVRPDPGRTPTVRVADPKDPAKPSPVPVVVVVGLKAGAVAPTAHAIGDEPTVLLTGGNPGTVTVEALGLDADGFPAVLAVLPVTVGGPKPEPKPDPGPGPGPRPAAPVKFVVVVEETAAAVPGRGAFFGDPALAARFKAKGLRFRVVDKDVVGEDDKPPADVARFLSLASGKPYPSLFLVDATGQVLAQRPVPGTPAALLTLLTDFGG